MEESTSTSSAAGNPPRLATTTSHSVDRNMSNTLFSACVAASSYWQWKHLTLVMEEQEVLCRRILRHVESSSTSTASRQLSLRRSVPQSDDDDTSDSVASDGTDEDIADSRHEQSKKRPGGGSSRHTVGFWNEAGISCNVQRYLSSDQPPSGLLSQSTLFGPASTSLLSQLTSDVEERIVYDIEARIVDMTEDPVLPPSRNLVDNTNLGGYEDEIQVSANLFYDIPIGFYVRFFIALILLDVSIQFTFILAVVATLHIAGALDPIIYRLDHWFTQMGLDRTRPLSELRARQTLQRQALQAASVRVELERAAAASPTAGAPPTAAASVVFPLVDRHIHVDKGITSDRLESTLTINNEPVQTIQADNITPESPPFPQPPQQTAARLRSGVLRFLDRLVRFIYQLLVALVLSLNPHWEPMATLIFVTDTNAAASTATSPPTVFVQVASLPTETPGETADDATQQVITQRIEEISVTSISQSITIKEQTADEISPPQPMETDPAASIASSATSHAKE